MAERFVSPGVFTRENDLSFLPQGIAEIGGAFIGPTVKGPAFVPTIVESPDEYRDRFGTPLPEFYAGHAAINYLKDARRATVVRVLGLGGYAFTDANPRVLIIADTVSGSGSVAAGLIFPTRNTAAVTPVALTASLCFVSGIPSNFNLELGNGNLASSSFTGSSLITTDSDYIGNLLGSSPAGTAVGYLLLSFPRAIEAFGGRASGSDFTASLVSQQSYYDFNGAAYGGFNHASTPWIQSQTFGVVGVGPRYNLFKIHSFSDGDASNSELKIAIQSTRPAASTADDQHGQFSLVVRAFDDTDARQTVIEQFDNLSIDPNSANYIARRIGDIHFVFDANDELVENGQYPNNSKRIYVEMADGIESVPDTALPVGFAALYSPIGTGSVAITVPSASYVTTRFVSGVENLKTHYGFDYDDATNLAYLNPLPRLSAPVGSAFSLEVLASTDADVTGAVIADTVANSNLRKFVVPLQGGFDGLNPARVLAVDANIAATNTQGFDLSTSTASGSLSFKRAIDVISNPEAFDINLIVMPGIIYQYHPYVCQLAIDMCEDRGDCFYIMDGAAYGQTVDTAINNVEGLDTNYAGTYHPWVKILDVSVNRNIWVPPSVALPQVYAFSDKVAAEWFAPAGLNRGGISAAVQVEKRLTRDNRDDLYEGRVNPIALFPGTGVVAFGQKTLQVLPSALDRINVRRLLIAVKKFIASSARFLVFEQNVEATRQRFLNIANPYLASIQERSGLYAFKVIMDDSNNTPDLIDRNILVGQIYLQPTRTAEFISLEFNILPTGATFPTGA